MAFTASAGQSVPTPRSSGGEVAAAEDRDELALRTEILEVCSRSGMQPIPSFLGKCQQLHETARVRHGIVIIGEAMSGKTSIIRALSRATTALSRKRSDTAKVALSAIGIVKDAVEKGKGKGRKRKKKKDDRRSKSQEPSSGARSGSSKRRRRRNSNVAADGRARTAGRGASIATASSSSIAPVRLRVINPKAISLQELFGQGEESTGEWEDGVLAVTMRACARDSSGDRKWILFDGPVDTLWIENMNTVLDDTKKLCLPNG